MFGVVTTATGGASGDGVGVTRFLFAGEYLDDTGLYYLRARFYDPVTASFVSVDPALSVTGSPYAYASGNPLQLVDPLGLWPAGDPRDALGGILSTVKDWRSAGDLVIGVGCEVFGGFFGDDRGATLLGGVPGGSRAARDEPSNSLPVDWGTGVAGVLNLAIGSGKILQGVGLMVSGVPISFTVVGIPVTIAAELGGGYQIVTGVSRIVRGGEQVADGFFIDKCQQNCDTTSNIVRLGTGSIVPGGGLIERTNWFQENFASKPDRDSDWIDFVGSLW